jgi:ribosome production factor 1
VIRRYIFPEDCGGTKARLQEMGPSFTLKLRSLQAGAFDSSRGEYEWINDREAHKNKRRFAL